jgi:hypothetical protein
LARPLHPGEGEAGMLIKRAPLEDLKDDEVIDVLERELEEGVQIDRPPEIEEDSKQTVLGGLVSAEEHVLVRELK